MPSPLKLKKEFFVNKKIAILALFTLALHANEQKPTESSTTTNGNDLPGIIVSRPDVKDFHHKLLKLALHYGTMFAKAEDCSEMQDDVTVLYNSYKALHYDDPKVEEGFYDVSKLALDFSKKSKHNNECPVITDCVCECKPCQCKNHYEAEKIFYLY